ncbi:unnamed protein product [Boreogadus saida]
MLACTEMITMCLQSAKRKHLLAQQQPLQITGQGLPIFHDIFRRADKNDDGKLTFEEFNTYFADSILTTEELQELFCSIDGRQNDNLDTEKLSEADEPEAVATTCHRLPSPSSPVESPRGASPACVRQGSHCGGTTRRATLPCAPE